MDPQSDNRTIECGEPSWSWLNLEGGIYLPVGPDVHLDARIILQKPDVPGHATMVGQHAVQIEACMTEFQEILPGLEYYKCTFTVKNSNYFRDVTSEKDRLLHGSWYPDTIPVQHGNLWALQTHSQWERIKGSKIKGFEQWRHKMAGLVITAVSDKPGFWRRMGTYDLHQTYHQTKQASDSDGIDEGTYEPTSRLFWYEGADSDGTRTGLLGYGDIVRRGGSSPRLAMPVEP